MTSAKEPLSFLLLEVFDKWSFGHKRYTDPVPATAEWHSFTGNQTTISI